MNIPPDLSRLNEAELQAKSIDLIKQQFVYFDKFAHKGTRGHTALIAGSAGMMGAAILAGHAANRSGTGKTTLFIPINHFDLIHQSLPEVLVKENKLKDIDIQCFDSVGIGPGLGVTDETTELIHWILGENKPLVIDADALNIIAQNPILMDKIPRMSILTPHLLEWERLFGKVDSEQERFQRTSEYAEKSGVYVIIKGHFSCLVTPNKEFIFNGTGNAGMAKGGSGDVLTGLLSGLLAQGFTPKVAAVTAMYLHGLAGDLAKREMGEETMTAGDQIRYFSQAFTILHEKMEELR